MKPLNHITQQELKEKINYNPITGIFIWIKPPPHRSDLILKQAGDIGPNGYRRISFAGSRYKAHRLAWIYVYGEFPNGEIDHINGARTDNRICNLRSVTRTENARNSSLPSNNTSGVIGLSWSKARRKWEAKIKVNQKTIHLGRFADKQDAINARQAANIKYGFHKNHGKQPINLS